MMKSKKAKMTTLEILENLATRGRVCITGDRYLSYDVTFRDDGEELTIAHCAKDLEKAIKAVDHQLSLYLRKVNG